MICGKEKGIPFWGWLGLILVATFWPINWLMEGLRSHWGFFPLWLGYILLLDGLTFYRTGKSMIQTQRFAAIWLFVLSSPIWWIFEWINEGARFWSYHPIESFSRIEYYIYCSINFSVVMPAVFSTAQFLRSFPLFQRRIYFIPVGSRAWERYLLLTLGAIMLILCFRWRELGLFFMWMAFFLILDPLNYIMGKPSLLRQTEKRDWSTVLVLWVGCLICGFFWEMWNYYSSPKWIYHLPFLNDIKIFEMPVTGYLGYLPFALELYAFYHFVTPARMGRSLESQVNQAI